MAENKVPPIPKRRSDRSNFGNAPQRMIFATSTPNAHHRYENVDDQQLHESSAHSNSYFDTSSVRVESDNAHTDILLLRQQAEAELEAAKQARLRVEAQMEEALLLFRARLDDDKRQFDDHQQKEKERLAKDLAKQHRRLLAEMQDVHKLAMKDAEQNRERDNYQQNLQLARIEDNDGQGRHEFQIGNRNPDIHARKDIDAYSHASSRNSTVYDETFFEPNPFAESFKPAQEERPIPKPRVRSEIQDCYRTSGLNPFYESYDVPLPVPPPIPPKITLPVVDNQNVHINTAMNSMARTIEKLAEAFPQHVPASSVQQSSNTNQLNAFMARQSIKRDLPKFSGNPSEWPQFIAQYRRTTTSCRFSSEENMDRLERCLCGKAKESVLALLPSPKNVDAVIKVLERRFGRPSYIIECLVDKARQYPSPKEDKFDMLIDFANVVSNLAMTMQSLDCDGHLQNPQLLKELVAKLPAAMRLRWGEKIRDHGNQPVLLTTFSDWLNDVADGASFVATFSVTAESKGSNDKRSGGFRVKNSVLTAKEEADLVAATTAQDSQSKGEKDTKPKVCFFCEKNGHLVPDCKLYLKEPVEKRWIWVKGQNLCYGCLRKGHRSHECRSKKPCKQDKCTKLHHRSLHFVPKPATNDEQTETEKEIEKEKDNQDWTGHASSNVSTEVRNSVLLKIVPVTLKGPRGEVKSFALLDEGSTVTMVDADLARRLGLKGKKTGFRWKGIGNSIQLDTSSQIVNLQIAAAAGEETFALHGVRTIQGLCLPAQSVSVKSLNCWKDIRNVQLEELRGAKPLILLGQDNAELIVSREVMNGPSNAPILSRTRLGWVIHGRSVSNMEFAGHHFSFHIHHEEENSLHHLVKDFFNTDTFGVRVLIEGSRSREDRLSELILQKTTKRNGDRFETGLLWRNTDVCLPESKLQAVLRLNSIEKKMDRNSEFSKLYCEKIEDYIKKGFIRKLSPKEVIAVSPRTWYLPHFGVRNHNKPGKFRLVFDAASKSKGVCLNDALYTGPDYLQPLPFVLYRFRRQQIGFIGDIGEMFHMVKVIPEDQQAQRFLWRGRDRNKEPGVYVMQVMTFGAACSPASAQFVKNLNAEQFRSQFPEAATAIVNGHYVDDYPDSADTVKEACKKISDVIEVHRRGGFLIRNWMCSNTTVLESIPIDLRSSGVKDLSPETEMPVERVLGLRWDPNLDVFLFVLNFHKVDPQILNGNRRPTKRDVLTLVMSIFDPLGFLACFVIKGKIILQEIWRSGTGWDDKVTDEVLEKWNCWLLELKSIASFKIPRCYFNSKFGFFKKKIQLHIFCDASMKAFASVAYFRLEAGNDVQTSFVTAKTRVAPLKPMSVPRLELQGALMASRLSASIVKGHDIPVDEVHFWTDSKTVLGWIRSDARRFKTFASHRVGEISELTDVSQWHYVPTGLNVADEATRDKKKSEFGQNSRWLRGPDFLQSPKEAWPKEEKGKNAEENGNDDELKKDFVAVVNFNPTCLPEIAHYSSWTRLIRVTAWIKRFVSKFCLRFQKKLVDSSPHLEPDELDSAELTWIKTVQKESFPREYKLLSEGREVSVKSKLAQLSPTIDSKGIIRLRGRINRATIVGNVVKQPVILDNNHLFTRILLDYYHRRVGHHGQDTMFNEVRQKYWVVNLRQAVRSTWSRCLECRFKRSQPSVPEMGILPECRLTPHVRPFTNTGVDYFGPIMVTMKRSKVKRYGVLFTCLTSRAVHLEIADFLNTDSAIMAIRRFVARRGLPKQIWSDNGTNFKGADRELRQALSEFDQVKICNVLSPKGIVWHFIPPGSPHMGGCWERLVKSVKVALKSILHERAPQQEVLTTLFAEAEYMVNCRPLTHVSVDPHDPESLTPNHFLLVSSNGEASDTPGIFDDADLCLRRQWRISQRLADLFWKRWIHEYLPTLTRRTKWHRPAEPIKIDDLVLIVDENLPRNTWLRGIVVAVYPGHDGQVRVVEVKTSQGIYRRPVAKVCVLDVRDGLGKDDGDRLPLGGMLSSPQEEKKK